MIPLSPQVLLQEVLASRDILSKWVEKIQDGIPGVDVPMSGDAPVGERLDVWVLELMGELHLVSGKMANVVSVFSEFQSG